MSDSKQSLLRTLRECAALMEILGENPFRCRAYEEGARALEALEGGPREWVESGILTRTKAIGKAMAEKVEEWARSGHIKSCDEVRARVPADCSNGVHPRARPKKIGCSGRISTSKRWASSRRDRLGAAAGRGRFGEKSAEKIKAGIEQRKHTSRA